MSGEGRTSCPNCHEEPPKKEDFEDKRIVKLISSGLYLSPIYLDCISRGVHYNYLSTKREYTPVEDILELACKAVCGYCRDEDPPVKDGRYGKGVAIQWYHKNGCGCLAYNIRDLKEERIEHEPETKQAVPR